MLLDAAIVVPGTHPPIRRLALVRVTLRAAIAARRNQVAEGTLLATAIADVFVFVAIAIAVAVSVARIVSNHSRFITTGIAIAIVIVIAIAIVVGVCEKVVLPDLLRKPTFAGAPILLALVQLVDNRLVAHTSLHDRPKSLPLPLQVRLRLRILGVFQQRHVLLALRKVQHILQILPGRRQRPPRRIFRLAVVLKTLERLL